MCVCVFVCGCVCVCVWVCVGGWVVCECHILLVLVDVLGLIERMMTGQLPLSALISKLTDSWNCPNTSAIAHTLLKVRLVCVNDIIYLISLSLSLSLSICRAVTALVLSMWWPPTTPSVVMPVLMPSSPPSLPPSLLPSSDQSVS